MPGGRLRLIEFGSEALPAGGGALDLRGRYGLAPDAPTAVFFGRLLPSKGLEDLLDAVVLVRERRPDARLVIAGPPSRGAEEGVLQRAVRDRGLEDVVAVDSRYVPNEEVRPLMELARFVVLPYRSATQSMVLHVAYACGRPVVATRVGGLPEVVEEGGTGRLVRPARLERSPTRCSRCSTTPRAPPGWVIGPGSWRGRGSRGTRSRGRCSRPTASSGPPPERPQAVARPLGDRARPGPQAGGEVAGAPPQRGGER